MFFVIVACTLVIVVADKTETFGYENTNDGSGNYMFRFMTSNGITRKETGRLVNVGEINEHIVVEGSYSYTGPDGKGIFVKYIADENGYHVLPIPIPPSVRLSPNVVASLLGK